MGKKSIDIKTYLDTHHTSCQINPAVAVGNLGGEFMTKLALFGAGGKMGMRLGANLAKNDEFETMYVEVSEAG